MELRQDNEFDALDGYLLLVILVYSHEFQRAKEVPGEKGKDSVIMKTILN